MEPTLGILLLVCAGLAALGYYFGYVRPPATLAWLQQSAFVFMTFLMVPFLSYVLWLQAGAVDRLLETGVVPHPGIRHAVGIAVGNGAAPTWIFAMDDENETSLDFYHDPDSRGGWNILSEDSSMLILAKGEQRMSISTLDQMGSHKIIYAATR